MFEDQAGTYKEPCGQCAAVNWGVSDEGRFYCKSCHNVIERTEEVVDAAFTPGSHRVSSISKAMRGKKTEQGRHWMVCEGFQFILKTQAEALLSLGVCPQFKEVLCQFWRMYLQKSRLAYTSKVVRTSKFKVRTHSESHSESDQTQESSYSASGTDGEGDGRSTVGSESGEFSEGQSSVYSGSMDASFYLTPRQRRASRLLTMPKTLALCHLALVWTWEAITLSDLLRLVNNGHMPYLNAYESFPEEMHIHGRDGLIFRVQSIPSHRVLHKEAHKLAVYLELPPFPTVTQHCLLHPAMLSIRYLMEANLPDELHDWVCKIVNHGNMATDSLPPYDSKSGSVLPLYDVQAVALIIVTMKLLFKMDDHTEWDLSNDADDKRTPENSPFSVRKWFKVIQPALTRARQTQQQNVARKQWTSEKPLWPSKKDKPMFLKRRRVVHYLQTEFEKLSGSPAGPPPSSPSSFRFCWGEEDGEDGADGPSLHQQTLDSVLRQHNGVLRPSNLSYWHPVQQACKYSNCEDYKQVKATLPKSYILLLEFFSFILDVKPESVYKEVMKVERQLKKDEFLYDPKKNQNT